MQQFGSWGDSASKSERSSESWKEQFGARTLRDATKSDWTAERVPKTSGLQQEGTGAGRSRETNERTPGRWAVKRG